MLNEDNNICYVELQANIGLGLDDVVVTYNDGRVLCIQVKHTRAEETLTFANLVCSSKKTKKSLLAELADSWEKERKKQIEVIPQSFTNRRKGQQPSWTKGDNKYARPSLEKFWNDLKKKIKLLDESEDAEFKDIQFKKYLEAWEEWKKQLEGIGDDEEKLLFLRLLEIETEQASLSEIENKILEQLSAAFSVSKKDAGILLERLDHALRK